MPRLIIAAIAAIAAFVLARVGLGLILDHYACATPATWWPDWAWLCGDPGARFARALTTADWDGALPLMLACGTFLTIGLRR